MRSLESELERQRRIFYRTVFSAVADAARLGTLARQAAVACSIALMRSDTIDQARAALHAVRSARVRTTALELFDCIATEEP